MIGSSVCDNKLVVNEYVMPVVNRKNESNNCNFYDKSGCLASRLSLASNYEKCSEKR